jgi:hypothetical protein
MTTAPEGRNALIAGDTQVRTISASGAGDGNAISPSRITTTRAFHNRATCSGSPIGRISALTKKVHMAARGWPMTGNGAIPRTSSVVFTWCARSVGIITAPTNPARIVIRPVAGSITVGREHTRR